MTLPRNIVPHLVMVMAIVTVIAIIIIRLVISLILLWRQLALVTSKQFGSKKLKLPIKQVGHRYGTIYSKRYMNTMIHILSFMECLYIMLTVLKALNPL